VALGAKRLPRQRPWGTKGSFQLMIGIICHNILQRNPKTGFLTKIIRMPEKGY
jgi:hypothetical protein